MTRRVRSDNGHWRTLPDLVMEQDPETLAEALQDYLLRMEKSVFSLKPVRGFQGDLLSRLSRRGERLSESIGWEELELSGINSGTALTFTTPEDLAELPLELLPSPETGKPVALSCQVARSLVFSSSSPRVFGGGMPMLCKALIVGGNAHAANGGLIAATAEAESLETTLSGLMPRVDVWDPESVEPSQVKEELARRLMHVDLLHIIGHSDAEKGFILDSRSGLRLEAEELASMFSCRPPWVVWMNTCEGGVLEGAHSFVRSCLRRGTAVFVGALLPMSDSITRIIAERFYSKLAIGQSVGQAMLAARQAAASHASTAWASLMLYGSPSQQLRFEKKA